MQKKQAIQISLAVCFLVSLLIFVTGCFRKRNHPVSLRPSTEQVIAPAPLDPSRRPNDPSGCADTGSKKPPVESILAETGCLPNATSPNGKILTTYPHALSLSKGLSGADKKSISLTVWIHGTVGSSFNLASPSHYKTGDIPDSSLIGRFMHQFRNQPIMHYDQVFGNEGFELFDPKSYNADTSALEAACYVIPAYTDVMHAAGLKSDIEEHAIFGWDGFLSQRARRAAASRLYDSLVAYRDATVKKYGSSPHITILAHSHGGNVALWLADCEEEKQKKLSIDLLFMYGTPMQVETGHCMLSPFFKRIFLGYSRGDSIQRRDYFSTSRYKSFMRMSDVADINNFVSQHQDCVRADIGFVVGGDDKRITHTNMWLLGRSVPVLGCMDPLPLVVLTPLIIAAYGRIDDCTCTHYKANLNAANKRCWVMLASCQDRVCRHQGVHKRRFEKVVTETEFRVCEKRVYKKLMRWSRRMSAEWRPVDPSRDVVFNLKNFQAIKGAVSGL